MNDMYKSVQCECVNLAQSWCENCMKICHMERNGVCLGLNGSVYESIFIHGY